MTKKSYLLHLLHLGDRVAAGGGDGCLNHLVAGHATNITLENTHNAEYQVPAGNSATVEDYTLSMWCGGCGPLQGSRQGPECHANSKCFADFVDELGGGRAETRRDHFTRRRCHQRIFLTSSLSHECTAPTPSAS